MQNTCAPKLSKLIINPNIGLGYWCGILGVNLRDLLPKTTIDLKNLSGKSIAIDAYNALYQFLAIIRQPDGTPLKDSTGRVTSHLSGLF